MYIYIHIRLYMESSNPQQNPKPHSYALYALQDLKTRMPPKQDNMKKNGMTTMMMVVQMQTEMKMNMQQNQNKKKKKLKDETTERKKNESRPNIQKTKTKKEEEEEEGGQRM